MEINGNDRFFKLEEQTNTPALLQIFEILDKISSNDNNNIYCEPRFVFRGITKYGASYENADKKEDEWTIRSGLSIRLEETHNQKSDNEKDSKDKRVKYSKADYISEVLEMINHARKTFPDIYGEDECDLNILADIQHNGGATCLVDFSKNILTSLWFACNNDLKCNGYLFCYNIMDDLFVENNLNYINKEEQKKGIVEILNQTYKLTNYCSDVVNRFCIWEPYNVNNRIARQDSVFIFGVEKFYIGKHCVYTIFIPHALKPSILKDLKTWFNISYSSIFNDRVGFAKSMSKENPLLTNENSEIDRIKQAGNNNLMAGNYRCAIEYFRQYEGIIDKNDEKAKLELKFSLAKCYKNLSSDNGTLYYKQNAMNEYREVVKLCLELLRITSNNENKAIEYYSRKCIRAYNDMLELTYKMGKYGEGIKLCDEIIDRINNNTLKPKIALKVTYCKLAKMELMCLNMLANGVIYEDVQCIAKDFFKDNVGYFEKIIARYYYIIYRLYLQHCGKDDKFDYAKSTNTMMGLVYNNKEDETRMFGAYVDWNFVDIKKAVDELYEKKPLDEAINNMKDATARIIAARDYFENQSWRLN
ncbi:MAG: FRG domain-containing protein [Floccifex sp.]